MGHTHHSYDEFGSNLTRPLYGHVSDLKSGTVPGWAKTPTESTYATAKLLGIGTDEYGQEIPRSMLPSGVSKDSGGRGPTRYKFAPETYLELHRERLPSDDEARFRNVRFDVRTSGSIFGRSGKTVPSKVTDRLNDVTDTSRWDRKVDGYHVSFRKWELVYHLGPRGGIQDVRIEADLNH